MSLLITSFGDPHYQILSENGYTPLSDADKKNSMSMNLAIHAVGKFYAVASNLKLSIQFIYGNCFDLSDDIHQRTCITGVFAQYKNEFVSVQYTENMQDKNIKVRTSNTTNGIQLKSLAGNIYKITVMDSPTDSYSRLSSTISITPNSNTMIKKYPNGTSQSISMGFFSSEIHLSPIHYQQTQGHCNVFDFTPQVRDPKFHLLFNGDTVYKTKFYDNNANALQIYNWTTSFTVDPTEDGFNTTTPINFSRFNSCSVNIKQSLFKRDTITSSTNANATTIKPYDSGISIEIARAQCVLCFGLQNAVLDDLSHDSLMSCADDIIMSGNNLFCNSHSLIATKNLLSLASAANTTSFDSNSTLKVSAQIQALTSFLTNMSTLNCNTGTKANNVCICKSGTSGVDCSVIVSSQIVVSASNNQPTASASVGVTMSVSLMLASLMVALFV